MNNEDKAREIANCNKCPYNRHHCKHNKDTWCHEYRMALEMAQWKDEQYAAEKKALIGKAWEWLKANTPIIHTEDGDYVRMIGKANISMEAYLHDFRKAMEEMK